MAEEKKVIITDKEGKDTGEARGPDEGYLKWMLRQGGIGIADTPGAFSTLYGLAGATKDYLYDRTDPTATPAKGFAENMYDPNGGLEKAKEYDQHVINTLRESHPEEDDAKIQERFDTVRKHSKKYYEDTTSFYRSGIAFGRKWGQGTNEVFGDPRLPSERTQGDTLMNIVGGSVPVPGAGSVVDAIAQGTSKVAGRVAGRVVANTLEATTPLTFYPKGATTGQIATRTGINVAIPEAIDQGARAYKEEPSVAGSAINAARDFYSNEDKSVNTERVVETLGAGGVLATILAARRLRNVSTAKTAVPSAGPTTQAMTEAVNPTVSPVGMGLARAGSDVEPFRYMGKSAGVTQDELDGFMTNMNRNARGMAQADHDAWWAQKVSPTMEAFVREDPNFIGKAAQHFADMDRNWGDVESLARTEKLLLERSADLHKATTSGRSTPARIADLTAEVNELAAERAVRRGDSDPNLRYSMMNESSADVRARLAQSRQDPKIRALQSSLERHYDDIFDQAVKDGSLSPAEAARQKLDVRKGNYRLTDNPMAQKGWLDRARQTFKDLNSETPHLVNSDPSTVLSLYRSATQQRVRKGYQSVSDKDVSRYTPAPDFVPHPRTNNPRNPFEELQNLSIRVRQAGAHNKAMSDYTDMMLNSPANANKSMLSTRPPIPENKIAGVIKSIEKEIADSEKTKGPFLYAYRKEGQLIVVQHNEKHIQEALKFAPAAVVPILNTSRRLAQTFITGAGNPKFGIAVSNVYDMLAGSLLRHRSMAFGPISYMAARQFGMGSLKARIISGLAAGPEAAINVFASYPYYLIKSVGSEFFGNIVAKRLEVELQRNSGIIATIGKMPGGGALIKSAAKIMSDMYDVSMTNLTRAYRAGHVANASDEVLSLMRNINAVTKKRPEWKAAANSYMSLLQVALDVPKHMALSQNLKLFKREVARGRQQARYMSEEFIADQARQIGGDMARISGSPTIQRMVSVMPWSNPGIQSLRYMKQRIMEAPTENIARLLSFGFMSSWAYSLVASKEETNDWFFNQLPNDARAKNIPFPNPARFIPRLMGVNVPQGTPAQEFILVPMAPEMMAFILPTIHGARSLGLIPNGDKVVVPQALSDDMKHARDAMFGLATPPIIQSIAGLFGKKIDPGKMIGGGSPISDIRDYKFAGANANKMSPQSRIPHAFYDAINGLLGSNIATLVEAANYGDIHANAPGGTLEKGIKEGTQKLLTSQITGAPGVSHVWPDANRRYIYTPIAEKRQKDMALLKGVDSQMSAEPGLRRIAQDNARINTTENIGATEGAVVGAPVNDPDLRALIFMNHKAFFSGPYQKLEAQRKVERGRHEALTIGADPTKDESPLMRFKNAQEQAKKVNELDRQLYTIYQDQWKQIETSPSGLAFRQKYGELTPENLMKAVQQSATENGQQHPR